MLLAFVVVRCPGACCDPSREGTEHSQHDADNQVATPVEHVSIALSRFLSSTDNPGPPYNEQEIPDGWDALEPGGDPYVFHPGSGE
jgi:hypothetical protein